MSRNFKIKRNDLDPSIAYELTPRSVDLTGATVVFNMKDSSGSVKVNRASGSIVTATGTPTVKYDWTSGDTDTAGTYYGEFEVTYASGRPGTFPNGDDEFIEIVIGEDIA